MCQILGCRVKGRSEPVLDLGSCDTSSELEGCDHLDQSCVKGKTHLYRFFSVYLL